MSDTSFTSTYFLLFNTSISTHNIIFTVLFNTFYHISNNFNCYIYLIKCISNIIFIIEDCISFAVKCY